MDNEFGDFEEIKEERKKLQKKKEPEQTTIVRVRMPRPPELLGVVIQRLGGNRMEVKTTDGKIRNCRVPGRFRRKFWLRPNDPVLIIPWETDDGKGDIIFQYRKPQTLQLKKRGLLNFLKEDF